MTKPVFGEKQSGRAKKKSRETTYSDGDTGNNEQADLNFKLGMARCDGFLTAMGDKSSSEKVSPTIREAFDWGHATGTAKLASMTPAAEPEMAMPWD